MNRIITFLSVTCLTALLFLLPVLPHASEIRAPNPGQAFQDNAGIPDTPVSAEDIRDIYGPILLPEPPPYLLYGVGILLAVLLIVAIWLLWVFMKKRKNSEETDPAVLALCSLKEAESGLPQRGILFFAGEVSQILRSYIEAQFSIPTTSCTTSEFFSSLDTSSGNQLTPLTDHDDILKHCLMLCDRIKFSRFLPDHDAVQSLTYSVRRFIETTRTKPVEEK